MVLSWPKPGEGNPWLFRPLPGLYHERMRIVCPACAAAYEVPDGRLLPGRVVRCARCDTDWAPVPELAAAEPEPEPAVPEPAAEVVVVVAEAVAEPTVIIQAPVESADDWVVPSGDKKRGGTLWAAWALSFAVLAAAGWFAYSAQESVMHVWPPSARAYAALGLVGKH